MICRAVEALRPASPTVCRWAMTANTFLSECRSTTLEMFGESPIRLQIGIALPLPTQPPPAKPRPRPTARARGHITCFPARAKPIPAENSDQCSVIRGQQVDPTNADFFPRIHSGDLPLTTGH